MSITFFRTVVRKTSVEVEANWTVPWSSLTNAPDNFFGWDNELVGFTGHLIGIQFIQIGTSNRSIYVVVIVYCRSLLHFLAFSYPPLLTVICQVPGRDFVHFIVLITDEVFFSIIFKSFIRDKELSNLAIREFWTTLKKTNDIDFLFILFWLR